ncbi:MAG: CHAP domain-containing protein [Streptosporangiaceae bacterium]
MAGLGRGPLSCDARIPSSVRELWRLGSCPAAASRPSPARPPAAGPLSIPADIAAIATSEDGVSDTPASTNFSFDCNPFTALENPSAPDSGCGTDPKFRIQDHSEEWCSDFAKYVWKEAGVTIDTSTITPLSSTFYTWGLQQGESMPVDGTNPAVGDAMILYPAGETNTTADLKGDGAHVGIVTAVHSDGTINVVNGDFTSGDNIKVVEYDNVTPGPWASNVEDASGEQWVYVAPPGSSGASGGNLWLRESSGSQVNTTAGMMPGTSPAITALSGGGYEVAFQPIGGSLWLRDSSGSQANTTAGMASGTSPSIAAMSAGGLEVAFQSNAHQLWLRNSSGSQANTTAGMDPSSSPSIAGLWGGGYEVAFQSNAHQLWLRDTTGEL